MAIERSFPKDTGRIFWQLAGTRESPVPGTGIDPLKALFSGRMGYSYHAFRQATLFYEEEESDFLSLCAETANKVNLYPECAKLLREAAQTQRVARGCYNLWGSENMGDDSEEGRPVNNSVVLRRYTHQFVRRSRRSCIP